MFLVVFRNRKRADIDQAAYDEDAAAMEELARAQPGFLSFKSYVSDDGEVIALSEWESEEAGQQWRRNIAHTKVQKRGRESYYADYTLFACDSPRVHQFKRDL